jgi:hypothetical protein
MDGEDTGWMMGTLDGWWGHWMDCGDTGWMVVED